MVSTLRNVLIVLLLGLLFAGPVRAGAMQPVAPSAQPAAPSVQPAALSVEQLTEQQSGRILTLGELAAAAPPDLPFRRVDGLSGLASIVLTRREAPYTILELRGLFPQSFDAVTAGDVLLKEDLIVGAGAHLVLDGDQVGTLRLLSSPARFVTVTAWRGEITMTGSPLRRLAITSWDPARSAPDADVSDGRAWVQSRQGRMSVRWVDFSYLGFAPGWVSGVAWKGEPGEPSRGEAIASRFRHGFFGAYTFEAVDMRWIGNEFSHNRTYGFDPHDRSNRFSVAFNSAFANGSHGIIFSRGCTGNVIRFNTSYNNGQHGIVIDDGAEATTASGQASPGVIPSTDNLVANNIVWGNEVGIVGDGGARNVYRQNVVSGNRYGIRITHGTGGSKVIGNRVSASEEYGVYLYNGSDDVLVANNVITGAKKGLVIKDSVGIDIARNRFAGMQMRDMSFVGDIAGARIVDNVLDGPPRSIDLTGAIGTDRVLLSGNQFADEPAARQRWLWRWAGWAAVLLIPVVAGSWFGVVRGRLRHLVPRRPSRAT